MNRTEWAEIFFEKFSARPLVAECILRSPKRTADNKEVCDHIFKLRAFRGLGDLRRKAEEMAEIPDKFNTLFASRGWIIHGDMNLEVAKAAVQKAEDGDIDGAEEDLVSYYSPSEVRWMLKRMHAVRAFAPRMRLAEKALIDYEEERYHACIPVTLALLDGLVSELHGKRRGFFAEEADLTAWDSIAAHETGLNALAEIFQKGRRKTNSEPITVPYRHGIMHGMDLAYDNRIVAAKTWGALFATREWALKSEQSLLDEQAPEPKPTMGEVLQQVRDLETKKRFIASWQPRQLVIGSEVLPKTGPTEAYPEGTPERTLAQFLNYWNKRNYGHMSQQLFSFVEGKDTGPARVREVYSNRLLEEFEFLAVVDKAAALTEIKTCLTYFETDRKVQKEYTFRLTFVDENGQPAVRGKENGSWGIVNWWLPF